MKSKNRIDNKKTNKVELHLVLYNYLKNANNEDLLKEIAKAHSFLSISVIGKNITGQDNQKQIEFFPSFKDAATKLCNHNKLDNVLVINTDSGIEGLLNAINKTSIDNLDIFHSLKQNYFIVKNYIFNSIDWQEENSLYENIKLFLKNNYVESKKYNVLFHNEKEEKLETVPKVLEINYLKQLSFNLKSFLAPAISNTSIYYRRKDFIFKESVIFRFLFLLSCVILFFLMPFMSYNTGISGDEEKHVDQAGKVYSYFETSGQDTSYLVCPYGPFYAYNITFDVALHVLIKTFNIENIYNFRHVINSFTGYLTILFCGLLVVYLAGWRAGFIAILLLFFSPRFIGHTYNNPKDIPFALFYTFSIYCIVKFVNLLPKISVKYAILIALGIGATLNIRIGGLLLIAYLFMFSGLQILCTINLKLLLTKKLAYIAKLLLVLIAITLIGYTIGFIFWPYGLENPIKNPMNSLEIMTNFKVSLRQTFEGGFIWSDNVPWYYTLKYILISVPITVLIGILTGISLLKPLIQKHGWLNIFILLFSFIFPLAYIIYKKSNVYGGWRHMIFAYVIMITFVGITINYLFNFFKNNYAKYSLLAILLLLSYHPVRHIIKNHPYQYIYFNQLVGGVEGAFGNYEIDYYYHSLREGARWLTETHLKNDTSKNIIVATNHGEHVSYYLRDEKNIKVTYVRYYDRGNSDWDYAIIANSYINPLQQKRGFWPPENTIHTIDVDDVPICAILKRNNKLDLEGYQKLKNRDFFGAIRDLNKAIELEKTNEAAYMNLATAYMYIRQFDKAKETIQKLLEIYPKYDKGLNLLGLVYYNQKNYEEAYKIFTSITEINPKFVSAYHNLGLVFLRMNKKNDALKYFQKAIKTNGKYKPPYLAIANILKEAGKEKEAQKYIDAANKLK